MFKKQSNYFVSIFFKWENILNLLEVPQEERGYFYVNEKYKYRYIENNGEERFSTDNSSACFEYYIIPNSIRNGNFKPCSSIFDQQAHRFFTGPANVDYGDVLINSKNKNLNIRCAFSEMSVDKKASFVVRCWGINKSIVFLFDRSYLNLDNAGNKWDSGIIPFDSFEISQEDTHYGEQPMLKNLLINDDVFSVRTLIQSQHEGGDGGVSRLLSQ